MGKLQPVRGTRDIYGEEGRRMAHVVDIFHKVGHLYGFEEFATPIFEPTEVFRRPLGEASDIVSKEMYTFEDRGGEEVTLRPEFTAGVCRGFISNGLTQNLPCRFMSHGPVFRYERPQKGRYRQFHQINAEYLGSKEPEADVDLIAMAYRILAELGIADRVSLHLNSLGDPESRQAYRAELVTFLGRYEAELSEDSKRRLTTNPLRILDSKDEGDRKILEGAPSLSGSLNDVSKAFFDRVQNGLVAAGVPFKQNEQLVRGLDYYTHTAFEFITDQLGAQGTVLAGGRYDGLIAQLGGPQTPGVGWAGGIERLAMLADYQEHAVSPVVILPMGQDCLAYGVKIAEQLRDSGQVVTSDLTGNLGKRLNRADKSGARFAVIIGEDEVTAGTVVLKDLSRGEQITIDAVELAEKVKNHDQ